MAYVAATAPQPYPVRQGKNFGWAWEIAPEEDGPASSLAAIVAAEVRIRLRTGARTEVVWTLASAGKLAIIADQVVLTLAPADTSVLTPGGYDLWVSIGTTVGHADDLILVGGLDVSGAV